MAWPVNLPVQQGCAETISANIQVNKHNSPHLTSKYAWIFVLGHKLFLESHSFPQGSLLENCLLL